MEWTVKDLVERIQKDNKDVGMYLQWAKTYIYTSPENAIMIINRFPPDKRLYATVVGSNIFIGTDV